MPKAHAKYPVRTDRFRALSRVVANPWLFRSTLFLAIPIVMAPFIALAATMPWIAAAWLAVALGPLAFVLLLPSRVDVGPDGLILSWMGRKRFVSFKEVVGAQAYVDGLGRNQVVGAEIFLQEGVRIKVPVGGVPDVPQAEALAERIRRGLFDFERADVGDIDGVAMLLDRGDRDVSAWLQALRALGEGANVSFRDAPVKPEGLWRIVESHAAPARDRVAATVALRASLTDDGQTRLRVAAAATMDPKLRVAIDLAANADDDGQLETALHQASARK